MTRSTNGLSRREFAKRASALSLLGGAAPWAMNLALMGEAAAQSAPSDYKALVCVFLYGGNDYANTLVPYDTAGHAAYQSLRSPIATPRATLDATALTPSVALADGRQYALAPQLSPLVPIFDAGQLAVLLNVGTLVEPTTKAQYLARSVRLPPKLFSHNDQQSAWQASNPEGATSGWGGRIGDLYAAGNGQSTFTCVSVTGNAVFLSGRSAVQYQVTTNGSVPVTGIKAPLFGSTACSDMLRSLITAPSSDLFEAEHARIAARSIDASDALTNALATGPTLTTPFPANNGLASQLRMVARMIGARASLGAARQVYFVSLGGFDNHDSVNVDHPALLALVGPALSAFHSATVELGVASQVTTFTGSDFGRTLTSNGNGSDHGWGSMHVAFGGAVRGGRYYGAPPAIANNGPDDVGQGRLLPTMAVDQLAATLATWFGVSASDLPLVVPSIGNYSVRDIGLYA